MGNNWNNKLCVVEGVIARFAGMLNACVDQYVFNYCHLNGFDSKETSVYYYFFQSLCQSQGINITVWNTHCSVTQGK